MTHVKNVAALEELLSRCTGYGGKYNPVRPNLQVSTMNALLAKAQQALRDEKLARNNYNNVTNAREITFKEIPKLASSMVYVLAASGASSQAVDDARVFFRQVRGRLATRDRDAVPSAAKGPPPLPIPEPEPQKKRRSGMLNYISVADNFEKLVRAVSSDPNYQPNEETLKASVLDSQVVQLKKLNTDVMEARTSWSNGMINRNQLLYTNNTAICSTAAAVKKYVRGIFGLYSEEYALIKDLKFTKPPKK